MQKIIIVNKNLEKIKKIFSEGGAENLQVLADFDKTLTVANGKYPSLISFLRNGNYLSRDYADKAHELFDKYHPFENDLSMSLEEKSKKMYEWWKKHFELLAEKGLDLETVKKASEDMINEHTIEFREGAKEMADLLNKNKIPFVIMSASIGNMIEEIMKSKGLLHKNVHVIANLLDFDEKGNFTKVKEIIHIFNKHEVELKNFPEYKKVKGRKNVILMGDSLGDAGMVEGFPYENLIKIGIFNHEDEKLLEEYKENFDIIITGDSDINYIVSLIKEILEK